MSLLLSFVSAWLAGCMHSSMMDFRSFSMLTLNLFTLIIYARVNFLDVHFKRANSPATQHGAPGTAHYRRVRSMLSHAGKGVIEKHRNACLADLY